MANKQNKLDEWMEMNQNKTIFLFNTRTMRKHGKNIFFHFELTVKTVIVN